MSDATLRRISVLFPGALGDFICFLPALSTLGENAQVDLYARAEFADLVPPAIKVSSLERYEIRRLYVAGGADDERVRSFFATYASIYSWTGSQQSEFVRQLECVSGGRARVFPFRASDKKMHQADYYLSCIGEAYHPQRIPTVGLRPDAVAWSGNFWSQHSLQGKAVLTLAPGSGAREKNWPVAFFRDISEWWRRETRGAVVMLVGPVEEDRGELEPLLDRVLVARKLTLAQAAALLDRSDLYLGNDSGITHLAAAMGVPTVALFGPSDAQRWAPRGARVTLLERKVECSPCDTSVMKSCSHRQCLTAFYPSAVIGELEKLPEVASVASLTLLYNGCSTGAGLAPVVNRPVA
jgi:ADP-heptose:LPS heptosyltransferase